MSSKQCPECEAVVVESKAYCPDCGSPMDEEQKRHDSSEYDSQMKTQNLTLTSQLLLLEQFDTSTFFNLNQKNANEPASIKNELKPVSSNGVEHQAKPIQFDNSTKTIHLIPQAEAKIDIKQPIEIQPIEIQPIYTPSELPNESVVSANQDVSTSTISNSKVIFYIVGGSLALLLFFLVVVSAIILGVLYWNYWK